MQLIDLPKKQFPLVIDPERIALPTAGARVTSCELLHAGEADTSAFGRTMGLVFTADTWRLRGEIGSVDPAAPPIRFELGIPRAWNGKLIQQGGGGLNGYVMPCSMYLHGQDRHDKSALAQGYAVVGSDSGHRFPDGDMSDCAWMENEECFTNFAYASLKKVHDTAVTILQRLCGKKPERVYFYGGSNGGRECIKALQLYPEDYDGAVCFYPVLYWTLKVIKDHKIARLFYEQKGKGYLDEEALGRLSETICDVTSQKEVMDWLSAMEKHDEIAEALDGILNEEQLQLLQAYEEPFSLPFPLAYGETTLPGYLPLAGADMHYPLQALEHEYWSGKPSLSDRLVSTVFMRDVNGDGNGFDPVECRRRILQVSCMMDAYSPNLDAFRKKGGKLLLVQGAADPLVTMQGTRDYFDSLAMRYRGDVDELVRFYIAPGYGHGMEDGSFKISGDFLGVLDAWVGDGIAPEDMVVEDIIPGHGNRRQTLSIQTARSNIQRPKGI